MNFISQVFAGKSLGRILFNRAVAENTRLLSGRVIDLAGGAHSYAKYLPTGVTLVVTDHVMHGGVDVVVDLNKTLPFPDASEQVLLCFNAVYILNDRSAFFKEAKRVLKSGGKLIFSSPFITNEMREPHDYVRLTSEGIAKELEVAGFSQFTISPYGAGRSSQRRFWPAPSLSSFLSSLRLKARSHQSCIPHMPAATKVGGLFRFHPVPSC